MTIRLSRLCRLAALSAASALAIAAAVPAGAQRYSPPAPVSAIPREHAQAIEGYGGLYQGPVAGYVAEVGSRVAAAAGRQGQCGFHVLNSDTVNAFTSPPGCHVYVTRGLLTLINSEEELASVLGHEVGHVTANHAGRRQQRSALTGIGALVLGALTRSGDIAQVAGQVGRLNVLSYTRNQEFEADQLGVRYLAQSGYSPYGLVDMLDALQREDQFDNARRGRQAQPTSAWSSTHPLTADRIARAAQAARAAGPPPSYAGSELPGRDRYLAAIDGLTFGDDPEQGFIEGRRFVHPGLRIGFEAPAGSALTNGQRAVAIEGPSGFTGQFAAGRLTGSLEDYAQQVLRATIGQAPVQVGRPDRARIGGFDAVVLPARAQSGSRGWVDVTVAAYADGASQAAYHFVTLSPAGQENFWNPVIDSFHRLSASEATTARPRRVEVVTVRAGDTAQSLAGRMAFDDDRMERFLLLNGLDRDERLRPGQRVKLVTYARR